MKKIICEMCGGTDLLKKDSVFECQSCGTKYSVEEAKKMMVEGTVDIKGTVQVDNTDFVEKYLKNARRAKQKEDWEETEKYYNMVEQNDPTNIEAIFYSSYAKAMSSLIMLDINKRESIFKAFGKSISIIDDNYDKNRDDNSEILSGFCADLIIMFKTPFTYDPKNPSFQTIEGKSSFLNTNILTTCSSFIFVRTSFIESIKNIISLYNTGNDEDIEIYEEDEDIVISLYKILMNMYEYNLTVAVRGTSEETSAQKNLSEIYTILQSLDSSFKPKEIESASGHCYVATCVYGSYDCPEVWLLRRFRDYTLAETWYGRAFIHTYYAISPTIVKWFGNTKWFKKMWRGKLDKMVANLKEQGIEDTPYIDREW